MSDAACEVWFYHLERSGLDQVLPELLEKTLGRGWKALVRCGQRERVEHLDGWLWSYREDSFLPHGSADEPQAERQPIVLTTDDANPNGADALFLIDGAEAGDLDGYKRCILLFDGRDEAALTEARGRWKRFKAQGLPVSYWRQGAERGWERQA
ncbi:DNA polymerase III subunit chi [Phenylobacterium montanum]|uniref:DNA polymerase III subunit chi n=1 Tax=Phenylobacterium montanum TaxID=2823693 RepID=A0A975G2U6_9CAUL|nr:DNA polymerase III subunit chi [Caulobacter sp. S6]QUD88991.1 DNA polymerase III subunit chi [Caulobacter sp. S6]